ncbi:N-acetyl-gamma-glutamyl-phosphate reductase [Dictyobacter arantiisoli]|uniref:N-acetyl-gamma-glutamyl-phosphate reductase n=1 Tax=Dictyobacter arantiisoli TaxID=2014874 RepID=A0A5A5TE38_9CHLR|nr:N-acetyl-gamma-glutamyl-phosphate reductase [Dictyobacter arantiisoli]GCF09495.1 N-acetyl-gamma-glutamyl-phosphate reductase [Dictyobacter arantiisoli]
MTTVSIVNVTSYTGSELLRLIAQHPTFEVTSVTGRSTVGKRLEEIFPFLRAGVPISDGRRPAIDPTLVITEEPAQTDLAFVCLPHAAAAEAVVKLLQRGMKVIDLSADFRLHDVAVYEEWYKHTHPAPALLESAVYGLCEHYRQSIAAASLVANPGCHTTTSILALSPAVAAGIVKPDVIIDTKTGISGGGRSPSLIYHFPEADEDVSAYGLSGHRHMPEIAQELTASAIAGGHPFEQELRITFVPHLMPMTRGILATCYADLKQNGVEPLITTAEVRVLYEQYYKDEPFVHVIDQPPHTKWTYGSNHCFIYPIVDSRARRLIVVSCLDNLVKGAAGQAIQNANILYGLPEIAGLTSLAVHP